MTMPPGAKKVSVTDLSSSEDFLTIGRIRDHVSSDRRALAGQADPIGPFTVWRSARRTLGS